jgi:hypothetical protein
MSFDAFEVSPESGRPIEFYTFVLNTVTWRYTTAETDITIGADVYTAAAIRADSVKQTGETSNDARAIDVPSWIAPAQVFMGGAPSAAIQMTVGVRHVGDTEVVIAYVGEITQVNFPIPGRARLTVESLLSSMKREGLRLAWQRTCPYVLYDSLTCKVNKATYKIDFVVLAIDGFSVFVALDTTQVNAHFDGGFFEWNHPIRGLEYVAIQQHFQVASGEWNAQFVLFMPPGELFEGARGSAYPGCDYTPTRCQFFSNYDNYGGVPDLPGRSPFDGNPVF